VRSDEPGITGDFAANPDLEVLARGIEDALADLLKAARLPIS
jgi:hypothetical protein